MKFIVKFPTDDILHPGNVRFHYNNELIQEKNIKRNDYVWINNKIIRRVLLGSNAHLKKNEVVIDYDSLLEIYESDSNSNKIQKDIDLSIKKISPKFYARIKFLLNSPNISDRLSFRLGLIGFCIGLISLFISIIPYIF